jgi:hypothetical protein
MNIYKDALASWGNDLCHPYGTADKIMKALWTLGLRSLLPWQCNNLPSTASKSEEYKLSNVGRTGEECPGYEAYERRLTLVNKINCTNKDMLFTTAIPAFRPHLSVK